MEGSKTRKLDVTSAWKAGVLLDDCGGYNDFSLIAEAYDSVYASRQDIDFFVEMAERCGSPVLEVGCGTEPFFNGGFALLGGITSARFSIAK